MVQFSNSPSTLTVKLALHHQIPNKLLNSTGGIHSSSRYVRDHYPFKRNVYPQLSLVQLDPDRASACLQKQVSTFAFYQLFPYFLIYCWIVYNSTTNQPQAFMLKYLEVGKVLFSLSILNSSKGAHVGGIWFLKKFSATPFYKIFVTYIGIFKYFIVTIANTVPSPNTVPPSNNITPHITTSSTKLLTNL